MAARKKPRPMHEWDQRNGNAGKDEAAFRNRPSAQARPVLQAKPLWPTMDRRIPAFQDPWIMEGVYDPSMEPDQPIPLLCNRCRGKHVGLTCKPAQPAKRKRHKRR